MGTNTGCNNPPQRNCCTNCNCNNMGYYKFVPYELTPEEKTLEVVRLVVEELEKDKHKVKIDE